jgi:hypothetical protein
MKCCLVLNTTIIAAASLFELRQTTCFSQSKQEKIMLNRVIGVMKLDVNTYEEIEADESATPQAAIVVTVVAVIGGLIGGGISVATGGSFLGTFLNQLLVAYIGWGVWSVVTYFVGTSLFGGKSDIGQMLRVLGFAQAPGILGIIPSVAHLWAGSGRWPVPLLPFVRGLIWTIRRHC